MENKTNFDLNEAVAGWRSSLAAEESIGPEQARELEAHLRDATEGWAAKGLTPQEAFQVAVGRIGKPEKVAAEFAKEDPMASWRLRMFWMVMGLIVLSVISSLLNMATTVPSIIAAKVFFPNEVMGATMGSLLFVKGIRLAQFILVSAAPLGFYFVSKRFLASNSDAHWKGIASKIWSSRIRFAMTVGVALAALGFAQYFVTLLWIMVETAGRNVHMGSMTFAGIFGMILYPAFLAILAAVVAPGFEEKKIKAA